MIVKPVVVRGNVFVKDLLLNATDDMHNKPELEFTEGGYFTSQDAFEVISSKVEHLPVNVGDRVTIKPENKEYTFKIVGILNRMTIGLAYIPKGTANKLIQKKRSYLKSWDMRSLSYR